MARYFLPDTTAAVLHLHILEGILFCFVILYEFIKSKFSYNFTAWSHFFTAEQAGCSSL